MTDQYVLDHARDLAECRADAVRMAEHVARMHQSDWCQCCPDDDPPPPPCRWHRDAQAVLDRWSP